MERTAEQHNPCPLLGWVLCTATWARHGEKKVVVPLPLLIFHPDCLVLKVSSVHITCLIFQTATVPSDPCRAPEEIGSISEPPSLPHSCNKGTAGWAKQGTQPHRAEELFVRKLGLTLGLCSPVSCCVSSRVIFKGCFMGIVLSWLESRYAALICSKKQRGRNL